MRERGLNMAARAPAFGLRGISSEALLTSVWCELEFGVSVPRGRHRETGRRGKRISRRRRINEDEEKRERERESAVRSRRRGGG